MANKSSLSDIVSRRREEVRQTLKEMVDAVDQYTIAAPLVFMSGEEAAPNEYLFCEELGTPGFWDAIEKWTRALYPSLSASADETDRQVANGDFRFLLGYLMGLRTAGIRGEELMTRAHGFILTHLYHEEWSRKKYGRAS